MDWIVINESPITGATLWINQQGTQVAACNLYEEPTDATALVSGVSSESFTWVVKLFNSQYWFEYQDWH